MTTWPMSTQPTPIVTTAQWDAPRALRSRYQQDIDLFTRRELARLRLIAWPYQTQAMDGDHSS
jgi:hypothetical protein